MRVICIDSSPCLPGVELVEFKTYHVEQVVMRRAAHYTPDGNVKEGLITRYILKGKEGSFPANRFIPYEVDFELSEQIFEALK